MAVTSDKDIYLESFSVLANVLFALCMFASVLKIDFSGQNLSGDDLIPFILNSFNSFANFAVAFIFLAMYWIKFVAKQSHLVRSDNALLIIWLFYLSLLCIYPFAENLIGNYPGSTVAQVVFSSVWAIIGFTGLASWWYASYAKLIDPALGASSERKILLESLPEPAAALISIPLAFYSDVAFYSALLLVVPANYYLSLRFADRN
ncbi:MAG: TMEM175 family protein [Pseudomonadales bacterium]